jgi:hypothetical protein
VEGIIGNRSFNGLPIVFRTIVKKRNCPWSTIAITLYKNKLMTLQVWGCAGSAMKSGMHFTFERIFEAMIRSL